MVQTALSLLLSSIQALLHLLLPLGLLLGAVLVALLLIGLLDRGRFERTLAAAVQHVPRLGSWLLAALALGVTVLGLDVVRRSVDLQLGAQVNAHYANTADPETSETVQQAPVVTYLTERTYTRTLTLPPDLLRRVGTEGVQVLAPYLQDPSSDTIIRLRDRFSRSGNTVVFSREATQQVQEYIRLDSSRVVADLKFVGAAQGGRQSHYNATFTAEYAFTNPLSTPATVRFAFPLPVGSGTLSGFLMTVNGQTYRPSDLSEGSVWEGQVPAGAAVRVQVAYQHQGSRGWSYGLAQRREPVQHLDLTVRTDAPARFQRYSLYPTSLQTTPFSSTQTLRWQLNEAITAQNVAVVFAQGSLRETLAKLHLFAPLAVLLGAVLLLLWSHTRRFALGAGRLAVAIVALGLGFALGGVLNSYLPPLPAELMGTLLGLLLAWLALGRTYLLPLLLTALSPLSFLAVGHAGLLLTLLGVGVVALLVWPYRQRQAFVRTVRTS
ncbi:hypothetical protein [Deinococcus sonorensis]|uniref:Permease n=2 Tax=Deinococcus sonorensis TaxID=309891 RepID=A0AAU7U8P9_9DEIO